MPKKQTLERARRDKREGKSASTQAGEFVREEIETIRKGEHGARYQAGDRHRSFEGEARWREITCSQERQGPRGNSAESDAGSEERGERAERQTITEAFAGHAEGSQA